VAVVSVGWIVVTGASRGIGLAVTKRLVSDGFGVVGVARDKARLDAIAAQVTAPDRFRPMPLDLSDHDAVESFWELLPMQERVVGLVNNAGVEWHGSADEITGAELRRLMEINVVGVYRSSVGALKAFGGQGGSIVNIASVDAHRGMAKMAAYCASKAAVVALTRAFAVEWAPQGVRVNSVSPGAVHTDMTNVMAEGSKAHTFLIQRTPQRRFGEPEEIAGAVSYLMSRDASFVTGADLVVDGGFLA
jgi:NAD(P)-dependent dehydrogenase (short-subunit alcohol dehydrogenase family)